MPPAAFGIQKRKRAFRSKRKQDVADVDSEIIARCQKGEREAQYKLYQRYKDWVFNVAYRMSNNMQEAEDISQKVFLRVFRNIDSFRGDAAFSSWIYRIAVNICINHFRKVKKHKETISTELSKLQNPDALLAGGENETFNLKPYLETAICALPQGYRMVFFLHDVQGYNHKEIAKMLSIADGTSKSQLHKARKELKGMLEPYLMMIDKI
ncbi:sigma-70 family RNA polymerase sigma factor [candidate division KSB1 bacterium]|nr:sigma-70 family RNA polymerase sigma factor [candidate division KSB1 bacterium]NIR72402.1 sigma-70 family RNA polymerase sigma factor [candidate division KSB1 bacterium]NIS25067.1 sigma-70 family RNA polymerase sigma factor [candidate division KSB1 bacterium]NIU25744.1 sigma-70 family RNA polymerase sigma factor [candidate division KSB1 bacterium]NIU93470.1 sigma-70 family RNA polymerase sigma factor [candidate division KSB1 bacterium]